MDNAVVLFVIVAGIAALIYSEWKTTPEDRKRFAEEQKGLAEEEREYERQREWENHRRWERVNNPPRIEEDAPRQSKEPELEPETPMQKFRRQNTVSECLKRGGVLTTGEDMSAMYGVTKEYYES